MDPVDPSLRRSSFPLGDEVTTMDPVGPKKIRQEAHSSPSLSSYLPMQGEGSIVKTLPQEISRRIPGDESENQPSVSSSPDSDHVDSISHSPSTSSSSYASTIAQEM